MAVSQLWFSPAREIARAIREREVSSAEVVEAHLQRIEALNPTLNAVVQVAADAAREQARAADAALARQDAIGPLHGLPFTVKDWLETEGVICAAGFEERANHVPKRDATVVARMRAAGAIMLGKTNTSAINRVYGKTYNPYDVSRTPGGSSSGESAIIAAGGSPLGLGSDSGGSIRYPAHCCGVAGLKPTNGRIPNTGHFPRIGTLSDPRTQIGPIARFVDDLALTLPVIAGPDWRDPSVIPMPPADPAAVDLGGLRAAFYTQDGVAEPSAETVAVVTSAARELSNAGVAVEETRPERLEEALAITKKYWRRPESLSLSTWLPPRESDMTGEDVERSLFEWDRFRRSLLKFMEGYDVILCPASEGPAGPHGAESARDFIYTLPYSLTGWPSVVVRAGASAEGLPIGVQVVARPWREDVALRVAQHIEASLGGWQPPPES